MPETWDLLDLAGQPTGEVHRRGTPLPDGRMHRAVHVWLYLPDGRLLIQQRASTTEHHPGRWGITGGSVLAGEDTLTAARRECVEELGQVLPLEPAHFCFQQQMGRVFMAVFRVPLASPFAFSPTEEVDAIAWMSWAELHQKVAAGQTTPLSRAYLDAVATHL